MEGGTITPGMVEQGRNNHMTREDVTSTSDMVKQGKSDHNTKKGGTNTLKLALSDSKAHYKDNRDMIKAIIGLLSLGPHWADMGTDYNSYLVHLRNGDWAWAMWTLVFIALPLLVNCLLCMIILCRSKMRVWQKGMLLVLSFTPLAPTIVIVRGAWATYKGKHDSKAVRDAAEVKMNEILYEALPQSLLQSYIIAQIIRIGEHGVDWGLWLGLASSVASLAFGSTTSAILDQARWKHKIGIFCVTLLTVASRFTVMAMWSMRSLFILDDVTTTNTTNTNNIGGTGMYTAFRVLQLLVVYVSGFCAYTILTWFLRSVGCCALVRVDEEASTFYVGVQERKQSDHTGSVAEPCDKEEGESEPSPADALLSPSPTTIVPTPHDDEHVTVTTEPDDSGVLNTSASVNTDPPKHLQLYKDTRSCCGNFCYSFLISLLASLTDGISPGGLSVSVVTTAWAVSGLVLLDDTVVTLGIKVTALILAALTLFINTILLVWRPCWGIPMDCTRGIDNFTIGQKQEQRSSLRKQHKPLIKVRSLEGYYMPKNEHRS